VQWSRTRLTRARAPDPAKTIAAKTVATVKRILLEGM
jgi:hypothetical protein